MNKRLKSEFVADLISKESKMDSIIIKQEPKYEDDFKDIFCEVELKVAMFSILKYYCDYYYYVVLYIVLLFPF